MGSAIRNGLYALILVVCTTIGVSHAETITAMPTSIDPADYGTVFLDGVNIDGPGGAGVGSVTWLGSSANAAPFNGVFIAYCIDLPQSISLNNSFTYTVTPLAGAPQAGAYPNPPGGMGAAKANEIDILYGKDYMSTLGGAAADDRAAFQLAIWNIVYDTDASVSPTDGMFYAETGGGVSSAMLALANGFLADAFNPANQSFAASNIVALLGSNGEQDQIVINSPSFIPQASIPAPAAALPAGIAMAGIAI
jgi:hypothetical protein